MVQGKTKHGRYDTLLFDADGTLFDFEKAEKEALAGTFRLFDMPYDDRIREQYKAINNALWRDYEKRLVSKNDLQRLRFARLFEAIGVWQDPLVFNEKYLWELGGGGYLIDGAFSLCQKLSATHRLAIVTNGIAVTQNRRLAASAIAPFISAMFTSEEIGYQKPDVEFFEVVFARLGIENKQGVLLIGDSLSADIQGGINAGIDTCWYNPNGNECGVVLPTYHIHDWEGLMAVV